MAKQAGNTVGSNRKSDEQIRAPSLPLRKPHRMEKGTERTFRDPGICELFGPIDSTQGKSRP